MIDVVSACGWRFTAVSTATRCTVTRRPAARSCRSMSVAVITQRTLLLVLNESRQAVPSGRVSPAGHLPTRKAHHHPAVRAAASTVRGFVGLDDRLGDPSAFGDLEAVVLRPQA